MTLRTSLHCTEPCFVGLSWAGTFSQVQNFGSNPSGARMYVYTPTNIASNPPIIVSIHYCTGTAQAMYTGTPYARYADQYGFIVIYPESPYSGRCWDVASPQTLRRDGGANSNSIANMVKYAISTYRADASRVFVMGASSGAMMTSVLAATYPDLFAAAIVYSGVPAGCFAVPNSLPSSPSQEPGWNSNCSGGRFIQTPQQWADTARTMYPGYTGRRPRMQIYHGDADTTLSGNNYAESMKQWSAIFGYTYGSPQQTLPNTPVSPYTKQIYGPNLQGILGRGIGHNVANMGLEDLRWFGIVV
ncbi:acetyl xylan esterase [Stachybotrys elegans]|uniref:Carboxylic ester hydrolase n=1 Tax=Stachybotrys elegans TaxID=80388 RepID=A0A8K0SUX0_9HYPO|nr:acetyl xylan esterase [Stachybotrys elegans]